MGFINGAREFFKGLASRVRADRSFALMAAAAAFVVLIALVGSIVSSNASCNNGEQEIRLLSFEQSASDYCEAYNKSSAANRADKLTGFDKTAYALANSGHYVYFVRAGESSVELYTDSRGTLMQISVSVSSNSDAAPFIRNAANAAYVLSPQASKALEREFKNLSESGCAETQGIVCELTLGRYFVFDIYPNATGSISDYGSTGMSATELEAVKGLLRESVLYSFDGAASSGFTGTADDYLSSRALAVHCYFHGGDYEGVEIRLDEAGNPASCAIDCNAAEKMLDELFVQHAQAKLVLEKYYSPVDDVGEIELSNAAMTPEIKIDASESCGVDANYARASFRLSFSTFFEGRQLKAEAIVSRNELSGSGFSLYSLNYTQI